MKKYVLDSFALLAYAENEKGANTVTEILVDASEGRAELFMSVVNFGELYYIAYREGGKQRAEKYKEMVLKYPIEIIDADMERVLDAAIFKANYKMSYADAFAAGLADVKKALLVTGDKEFLQVKDKIKLVFLN